MDYPLALRNFTSDLRALARNSSRSFSSKKQFPPNDVASPASGIDLQTELFALAAFDQLDIRNGNSDLNTALKSFFASCRKVSLSQEAKAPLAFFGGLGVLIFRSMETNASVKNFRVQPDVQQRLSDICNLLGVNIASADRLGTLLHDLRQVIFTLGTNSHVDKMALLALIRRAWCEVSGSENEGTDFDMRNLDNNDFGEVEAATLIDLFSVTSELSSKRDGALNLDALEIAVRRNVEASIQRNQLTKPTENGSVKPDEWSRLRGLLEPVCKNLQMDITQVVDMIFKVLKSSHPSDSLQSELIDMMGFDQFDTVAALIRERTEWLRWYKWYLAHKDAFTRDGKPTSNCSNPTQRKVKDAKLKNRVGSTANRFNVVKQLLEDAKVLEDMHQASLLAAATHARNTASEAYYRSIATANSQQSPSKALPFVFDIMAEIMTSRPNMRRSEMVLPKDTKHKQTPEWESYEFPSPIRPGENEDSRVSLVRRHLPNGGSLVEVTSLDRVAQLAFKGVRRLNLVQSVVFETAYNSGENLLISAPTGSGKTNTALLTILHLIRQHINSETGVLETGNFKIVYMAPMKALAAEMAATFGERLAPLGVRVKECTGDMQLSAQEILETQMLVTTPEKWDVISRKGAGDASLVQALQLLIIDEVHLLHEERGAVIEALVARTLRQVEASQRLIRIVGLSATLPNYLDVAAFLRVNPCRGLFYFDSRFRPVPLDMAFVGVHAPISGSATDLLMNQVCYERIIEQLRQDQQVMIFVHARGETMRTARWLLDRASQSGDLKYFEPPLPHRTPEFIKRIARVSDLALRELAPRGIGCHHAGMLRPDRTLVERLFREGALRVLVCTATLAWGVNLPAHAVVIKGTRIYDPDRSDYVDLDILDVLQIFGRAGRPQFDRFGLATIITTRDKLDHYVRLVTNQVPIESNLLKNLNDHLNAEIALGTVSNVSEAVTWLSYTYLFVRLTKSPLHYGITPAMLSEDPDLTHFLTKVVEEAATALDDAEMIRFEPSTGQMASTDRGRTASLYYISYATAALVRQRLHALMRLQDLIGLVAEASEFAQMKVRDEEEAELQCLRDEACRVVVKNPGTVEGTLGVKVNVLLQAHISRARPTTHSLVSDMFYVQQNAGRLARYTFEIALRLAWSVCATSAHRLSKMIEHRLWYDETPLWQFIDSNVEGCRLLDRVDDLSLRVDRIRELDPSELNGILHYQGLRGAEYVCRLASYLPLLTLVVDAQPVTRNILRITVRLTADFTWIDRHHGNGSALLYWLWVEDPDDACIYHSEAFALTKKMMVKAKGGPLTELVFTIPIHEPLPSQYLVRCISDRYLGVETLAPVHLRNILLPQADPPHSDLLPLDPLPIKALNNQHYEALYSFTHFNPIQTQVFHTLYHQDVNVLLGAPTGSGKTAMAELAMFRVFNTTPEKKCVYIAPLKALVRERVDDWSVQIGKKLGKRVVELTGDVSPDASLLRNADVIVSTPEKWDGVSRSWRQRNYVRQIALIVIDEIHMVGEDRGPVIEAIVSRANFIANQLNTRVRIVGLSTALANAVDMAVWLRVPLTPLGVESGCSGRGLFNFRPSVRPVPLEVHIQAFPGRHYCPRMALMNKPIFQAIQSHSAEKPVLVFVASRRQTRRTAFDLISHASSDFLPRRWLHMDVDEMEALASTMRDQNLQITLPYGIGIHHAGLRENDRRIVEELFVNQKIQVLIATSTLAWGVNFPAHLVIVKGTEYFDGKTKRYVDYPITDVLQMMGRAGRPQFDTEGKAVVMVQDIKKAFYKRFLYEPFPVESCLPRILPDYLNAEVASGSVASMQAAVECITWTFYFRRLLMNPNYYHLEDTSAAGVSAFLSAVVSSAVEQLMDAGCVEVGEPEFDEMNTNIIPLYSTAMGRLASFYYISHKTIRLFAESLSATTSIEDLIYILSMSEEFADIPVRHSEDEVNATLAGEMPLRLREPPESGHAKAHLLLQAHLSRKTLGLPVADYITDTASLLEQTPRLLAALLDCAALGGHLAAALRCVLLGQMIGRALWLSDSPLLQLSASLDSSHLAAFHLSEDAYVETLPQLLKVAGAAPRFPGLRDVIGDRLAPEIVEQIRRTLLCLPIVSLQISLAGGPSEEKVSIIGLDVSPEEARQHPLDVHPDTDYALIVTLNYENTPSLMPRDHGVRQSRPPGWVVALGEPMGTGVDEGGLLLGMKKTTFRKSPSHANVVSLSFRFDDTTTTAEGLHELSLYLMSDTFLSMDQQLSFCLRLLPPLEGEGDQAGGVEDYEDEV
uniref:Activating signal cointegrator 1 complex subunit n=1 Tax=Echinococcus granulosus TaxID=6210 RepID=A0A068WQS3_ECHGR|nr:Activating signal cointegrator 1 complex subunit [Echinococcus granulosus]